MKLLARSLPFDPSYLQALERKLQSELDRRKRENLIKALYPDDGDLSRDKYPKHMAFFAAGREHNERAFMGGNRTGKSTCISFEGACHAIGWYPDWWPGYRFTRPITAWLCGEDVKALRESLQIKMLGNVGEHGTGMIPKDHLVNVTPRSGVPEAVDTITIRSNFGGFSRFVLKTYDQGRESYQGAKIDVALMDEEPPMAIYTETLMRTMATAPNEENGLVMSAFTPLKGLSDVVLSFMPNLAIPT